MPFMPPANVPLADAPEEAPAVCPLCGQPMPPEGAELPEAAPDVEATEEPPAPAGNPVLAAVMAAMRAKLAQAKTGTALATGKPPKKKGWRFGKKG